MNDVDLKAAQAKRDKLEAPLPPAEAVAGPQETEVLDRVVAYIKGAMRPQNIATAASEGPWDRGRRAGLQEALNSIAHESASPLPAKET